MERATDLIPARQHAWEERTKRIVSTRRISRPAAAFISRPIGQTNTVEGLFKGFSWFNLIVVIILFVASICVVLIPPNTGYLKNDSLIQNSLEHIPWFGFYDISVVHPLNMHGYVSLEAIHFNIFAIVLMVLNFSWVLIVTIECWFVWRFKVVLGRHWLRSVTIVLLCGAIFFTLTGISAVATDILPIQVSIGGSLINKWLPQSFLFHVMVFDPNSSINPHYQYVLSSGSWLFILIACLFVVSSFYVMLDYKTKIKMANVLGFRHISELNK